LAKTNDFSETYVYMQIGCEIDLRQ